MRDWSREQFLTVAEVAGLLQLNQQTIRNWVDDGKLPHVRVGDRRVRILRSDLEGVIRGYHDEPAPKGSDSPTATDFWGGEAVATREPLRGEAVTAVAAAELRPDALDEVIAELFA